MATIVAILRTYVIYRSYIDLKYNNIIGKCKNTNYSIQHTIKLYIKMYIFDL